MWDLLLSLAKQSSPLFGPLFVLSVFVNVYQYKLNNVLQQQRLQDWQTALNLANNLAAANQKIQESVVIMIQGIDKSTQGINASIQRLLDKEKLT